jgi:hypothetical protein
MFGLVLVLFLILFIRYQQKPVITGLDRLTAASGDRLEISGRHFGDAIDGARLFIGSSALTSTGIIEWEDDRILARVPRNDGAVLVKVRNRAGTSKGVVLGDSTRFPRVDYGPWLPGAPFIEYGEPGIGVPGTLVTLYGEGFGDRVNGGTIWVNRHDDSFLLGTEKPDLRKYIAAESVISWSDRKVSFRLPQGMSSGNMYLQKEDLFSNPFTIEVGTGPGVTAEGVPVQWSLRQDVAVQQIGSFQGNSLYLHIPAPVAGSGQGGAVILEVPEESDGFFVRNRGNLSLYRLDELQSGDKLKISRQLVVEVAPVKTTIRVSEQMPYDRSNPEIAAALAADRWIRPDLVSRNAAKVVAGIGDDWSKSYLIYNYVISLLTHDENPPSRIIPEYLNTRLADSQGYSFLFASLARAAGVPARPVGGLVVLEDRSTRIWWWTEVWMQGIGWIPVDPAMGDSALRLPGTTGDMGAFYFGGLEGRHIAFSRGILPSGPLQPHPALRVPSAPYSLQGAWEEVSGNLQTYTSLWPVPRVTAAYQQE